MVNATHVTEEVRFESEEEIKDRYTEVNFESDDVFCVCFLFFCFFFFAYIVGRCHGSRRPDYQDRKDCIC